MLGSLRFFVRGGLRGGLGVSCVCFAYFDVFFVFHVFSVVCVRVARFGLPAGAICVFFFARVRVVLRFFVYVFLRCMASV